jgi:O-antigen/teichoic acid export membrane protein
MASAQAVTWALAVAVTVVVPRYLGPESQGMLELAATLWAIAAILSFGATTYLQLQIARRPQEGLTLVGTVLRLRTSLLLVSAIGLAVYVYAAGDSREFVAVLALTGISTFITSWSAVHNAAFLGLERMATPAFTSVVTKALSVVGLLAVVAIDGGIYGILLAGIAASTAGLAVLLWRYRDIARPVERRRHRIWTVLIASLPFTTFHVANTVYRGVDVIVISTVAGDRDVGWYSTADLIIGTLLFPATIVLASVFPSFGRLHAADPRALADLVRRTFSLLFVVAVPIGLGTAMVGPTFATLLLGDEYSGTGQILVVMGPVLIASVATTLISQVALVVGRGAFWSALLFAAAVATIALDIALVPWASDRFDNGGIGGAMAFVVTEVLQLVIGIAVIAPYLASWRSLWRVGRIFAAGAVMCVAVWPFRTMVFLVPAAIGAIAYGIAVFLLRVLDDYERHILGSMLNRIGIRTRWAEPSEQ